MSNEAAVLGYDRAALANELKRRVDECLAEQAADLAVRLKSDGSWVTAVDHAIQARIKRWLARQFPRIGFLGEEMSVEAQQAALAGSDAHPDGLWILDPLDGTSNFRVGFPVYSTTLALIRDGEVVLGLVYDPCRDELFSAAKGEGAWLNSKPLRLDAGGDIPLSQAIASVDFKRLPPELACRLVSDPPYASQRSIGSVALDWCWVAAGRVQVYLHGKQKLWDYAAGKLILAEAGGVETTLSGQPAPLSLEPRSAVCAVNESLLAQWCEVLRSQ